MEKTEILKTLSDVLGFDCSDFGEVMENGIVGGVLYDTKEEAEDACKKIRALAEMLDYSDKSFKVYFDKDLQSYIVENDEEIEQYLPDSRPVLVA
jgi:hypothetical protein